MANNVLIFDTSVLCCLLEVPGKSTCGPQSDFWDKGRVLKLIKDHKGSIFVLPLASIIETGNHISQANGDRFNVATAFCKYLRNAASGESPWAAFSDQAELWKPEQLLKLSADWPQLASSKISIGDATIKDVAEYYSKAGFSVEIATGDAGLKAYQPLKPPQVPRRRQ